LNRFLDLLVGPRSENSGALPIFAALGLLSLFLFVLLPDVLREGYANAEASQGLIGLAMAATILLLVTVGVLNQWCVFIAGKPGKAACYTFLLFLNLPLHLLGLYYENNNLLAFTASGLFVDWLGGAQSRHPVLPKGMTVPTLRTYSDCWPFFVTYGLLLIVSWLLFRRRLAFFTNLVDQKLEQMGVKPAIPRPQ
jgi:hypothetical protein